jgi:hypothetical protein
MFYQNGSEDSESAIVIDQLNSGYENPSPIDRLVTEQRNLINAARLAGGDPEITDICEKAFFDIAFLANQAYQELIPEEQLFFKERIDDYYKDLKHTEHTELKNIQIIIRGLIHLCKQS